MIDKDALVAEIEKTEKYAKHKAKETVDVYWQIHFDGWITACRSILSFLDTLEVKEIHEDIDVDLNPFFEESGVESDSRIASMFKKAFYEGLDKYLNKKENKL